MHAVAQPQCVRQGHVVAAAPVIQRVSGPSHGVLVAPPVFLPPMRGNGQPAPVRKTLVSGMELRTLMLPEHRDALRAKIRLLFREAAGSDRRLQLAEMIGLANALSVALHLSKEVFGDLATMFYSYDFSGDGNLDEEEGTMLIEGLMRAARDAKDPSAAKKFVGSTSIPFRRMEKSYNVLKQLGVGGQGAVYLAADKGSAAQRVVKLYKKANANAPVEDIVDEFNLLKSLDHPKIARTYDIFQDHMHIFVVSEPYFGGDLVDLVPTASEAGVIITEAWLANIFKQVTDGLRFLHSKHTMHCDLKEANAMVSGKGQLSSPNIVLIDFGLAASFDKGAGGVKGTPGYMPPEVWQLGTWTPKGDTFSLGVMFYRMATFGSIPPFGGNSIQEIKWNTLMGKLPEPSPFAHRPLFDSLLCRMLGSDFRSRPSPLVVSEDMWFRTALVSGERLDLGSFSPVKRVKQTTDFGKALLTDFATKENLAQLEEINQLFMQLDKDNSGTVNAAEVRGGLAGRMPPAEIEEFVQAMVGPSGEVAYTEFMGIMMAAKYESNDKVLLKIFEDADLDNSGFLDLREISALLQRDAVQALMKGRSASSLMREMDTDNSGRVSFLEFRNVLCPPSEQAGRSRYKMGETVEYYSASHSRWIETEVTALRPDGSMQLSCKANFWILAQDVCYKVRPRTRKMMPPIADAARHLLGAALRKF